MKGSAFPRGLPLDVITRKHLKVVEGRKEKKEKKTGVASSCRGGDIGKKGR